MTNRSKGSVWKNILFTAIVLIIFIAVCDVVIRTVNRIYLGRQISEQKKRGGSLLDYEEMIRTGELSKGRRFAVVVGDSITFGYNLRSFKESYPFQLDKIFAYVGSGTKRMRVVTDSKPGGNTFHEMYALMHMVYSNPLSHDDPGFAVVGYCLNDAIPNFGEGLPGMVNKAKISTRGTNDLELTMASYEKRPEMVDKGFEGISKLSKERNFPVLVVIFPYIIRTERYPVGKAHEMVAEMASERGFEVIDLRDAYEKIPVPVLRARSDDMVHPSPLGHKIAADAIFVKAVSNGWVKGLDEHTLRREVKRARPADAEWICRNLYKSNYSSEYSGCRKAVARLCESGNVFKWERGGGDSAGEMPLFIFQKWSDAN